ncbi:hypothetical protein JCM1841_000125 [Sporobolomyces salmonicolor]
MGGLTWKILQKIWRPQLGHLPLIVVPPSPLPLASFGIKFKIKEPKTWTGEYNHVKREGWIKTVKLYLAGLELDLDAVPDEHLTPLPFFTVRALFSPDAANGSISPQAWFDARNRRDLFLSANGVLNAVQSHSVDDHAAEQVLKRYRSARQDSSRAHNFSSSLDALAEVCLDCTIDDLNRHKTFVDRLRPAVQDFVKTQLAMRKAMGRKEPDFNEVVKIASLTDSLSSFAPLAKSSAPAHAPSPSKKIADATVPPRNPPSPTSRPGSTWSQDVTQWQQQNPELRRLEWFDARGCHPAKPVRCYNCGEVSEHYSQSCMAARKDPKKVIVAMLSKMSISSPSPHTPLPSPEDEPGKVDEE